MQPPRIATNLPLGPDEREAVVHVTLRGPEGKNRVERCTLNVWRNPDRTGAVVSILNPGKGISVAPSENERALRRMLERLVGDDWHDVQEFKEEARALLVATP